MPFNLRRVTSEFVLGTAKRRCASVEDNFCAAGSVAGTYSSYNDYGSAKSANKDCLQSSSCLGVRALRESIQLVNKRIIQLNQSSRGIFFKFFYLGSTGTRQHRRGFR